MMTDGNTFLSRKCVLYALLGSAILALAALIIGMVVGRREVFPFNILYGPVRTMMQSISSPYDLATHLYALEKEVLDIGKFTAKGGAIDGLGDDLLIVTPRGRIMLARPNRDVVSLEGSVPMNEAGLVTQVVSDGARFEAAYFRVADVLLWEPEAGRFELFVTHHYFDAAEECIRFRLSSATILQRSESVEVLTPWRTIFDAEPCLTFTTADDLFVGEQMGGRMVVDGPDHLLVIIGDHGWNGWNRYCRDRVVPDDVDSHLGKLVRVDITTGDAEVLTLGHRNPQGLAYDLDGNLWSTEHGPAGGDELNILQPAGHYGWPHVTYGTHYEGQVAPCLAEIDEEEKLATAGRHGGFVRPVFSWVPSISPSSLVVNDPRWFPLWGDDLLIGTLGGCCGNGIYRVRRHGTSVQYVERIDIYEGRRIRDMTTMPDGRIALLTECRGPCTAQIVYLRRSTAYCTEEARRSHHVYAVGCKSYRG